MFYGYRGAKTYRYGYDTNGNKIKLLPIGLETTWDIDHSSSQMLQPVTAPAQHPGHELQDGRFQQGIRGVRGSNCPIPHPQYAYVPRTETEPYFDMAQQYVLADQMYASNFDASSFISHQYIISAQAESAVNYPTAHGAARAVPAT